MRVVLGTARDERASMPGGGVWCREGPLVQTHHGQVCQLQGPTLQASLGLPEEEGGPQRGKGVEVPLTQMEAAGRESAARRPTAYRHGGEEGEEEVEEVRHESSSGEEMEE